ncbi:UNVERIFIED_ORG: transposase IS66-like protein [Martelella mediterranea]
MRRRFDLTDFEWAVIEPFLPNNSCGVPRVDDRRVINGILWRFRTGSPWADVPERYGPHTTCYNRFAEDGMKRIGELYKIEAELGGLDPEARLSARKQRSAHIIAELETWITHHRARVAAKSPLGEALKCIAKYWEGLQLFLTDGRVEIDNNTVERTIRPIALNRKNALFAGHDAGAENWATIASLIETCKLNSVNPQAYLTATLTAIINGHKQSKIGELLPWNYSAKV